MTQLSQREVERLELEEKIKANAGKQLDYFILPSVAKRPPLKKNKNRSALSSPKYGPSKVGMPIVSRL